MSSRRFRHSPLRRAAALLLTLAPFAIAPAGVSAGALTLGFLAHGHGHRLSLSGDVGHVDLVLHHQNENDADSRAPGLGGPAVERHDDDHVVHLASPENAGTGSKRASAPLGVVALPSPVEIAPRPVAAPSHPLILASRRSAELLRTVVLRI